MYTVREMRPAESLWGIAARELGDGERWREIADLNEGRTMVDGHIFHANSFLQPGWQLQMPSAADPAGGVRTQLQGGAPDPGKKDGHVVTVHSGDYLSKIAEEELGDGDGWPRLFEASRDKPQPNGLPAISDPDVIYAGQQVTVPGSQPDQPPQDQDHSRESESQKTTPPATQKPDGEQTPGGSTGDGQAPAPSHTAAPAPQASAPSTQASRPAEDGQQDHASPSASASATPTSTSVSPSATSPSAEASGSATSSPPPRRPSPR